MSAAPDTWSALRGSPSLPSPPRIALVALVPPRRIDIESTYIVAREASGMTVEEWETANGFPPFTVFPQARSARGPDDAGFFMYADRAAILAEERRQMACLRRLGVPATEVAALYGCGRWQVRRSHWASNPARAAEVAARRAARDAERGAASQRAAERVVARRSERQHVHQRRAEQRADRIEARRLRAESVAAQKAERGEAYRQMGCLRALGIPLKEVAALYRTSMSHVARRADGRAERAIESAAHREEEDRQMACLRRLGLRLHEIAALYGCVKANVCMRTKRLMCAAA